MKTKDHADQFREIINKHDTVSLASKYASNIQVTDPFYPEPLKGRDSVVQDFKNFITAFPDLSMKVVSATGENGVLAMEVLMTGTNDGPLDSPSGPIPATHKKISFPMAVVSRFDSDGLIYSENRYYDVFGIMHGLGLVPDE